MQTPSATEIKTITIGSSEALTLERFQELINGSAKVVISEKAVVRLKETRTFIDHLLKQNITVYGLTTGFADLRDCPISPDNAAELSKNIILSHDAGIGKKMPDDVVLGAMLLRAASLAEGYSGFQAESLNTLVEMINHRIIPHIPETGSLGASGDLATLSRLGRAMQGHDVPVSYNGKTTSANAALKSAGIKPFHPEAKEGLALTNGTSFMASMIAIAYLKQLQLMENILAMEVLFLNSIGAIDAAFKDSIHQVRRQVGQIQIAQILSRAFEDSPFADRKGVQNDYCVRCIPQLFGPRLETLLEQKPKIERELNAVTDNPLLFKNEEITADITEDRIISFGNDRWAILSGGNFHGEIITSIADSLVAANAKLALTLERQITYMMNPARNRGALPAYLLEDYDRLGLHSSYMLTQYAANALAQKIAHLGTPASLFNITSANESEDVVSYGASAAQNLLAQQELLSQFSAVFLTVVSQSYGIARKKVDTISSELLSERLFQSIQDVVGGIYPTKEEDGFEERYNLSQAILNTDVLRETINFPLQH